MRALAVYGLETSNNMKVRVALGYKGLAYEFHTIDRADRTEILRISGQHLTPVLVHGEFVLFDSSAILRYLDVAFRETPRLFGSSHGEQWEIEDWEFFARTELAGPMMEVVHRKVQGEAVDDERQARCAREFGSAVSKLATAMDGRQWLVGDAMSAADITAAAVMKRIRSAGLFEVPSVNDGFVSWEDRVMAYDGRGRA